MNNIKDYFLYNIDEFDYILKWNDKSKILMDKKYMNSLLENLQKYK